jgi:hypothetical protein
MSVTAYAWEVLREFARNAASPWFYVALSLIYLQYRRQNRLERHLFGLRVTSPVEQTMLSLVFGIIGGAVVTALLSLFGIVLRSQDFTYIWIVAILLACLNVRYICFAYAGGILSLLSLLLQSLPPLSFRAPVLLDIYRDLLALQVSHVLALVAVLHLVEAMLVWWQGGRGATPVFLAGKRGRLVGGFALQKFWVLPLAAGVLTGVQPSVQPPSWWGILPLPSVSGLEIMPVPAVLGFAGLAIAREPAAKAKRTAGALALYALCLLLLVIGSAWYPPLLVAGAVFAPLAHEWIVFWERADERNRAPLYVHPVRGLRILAVLPKSPAREMGLSPGETILRVNGMEVCSKFDLHAAIDRNPAFVRLEVADVRGEIRLVKKPLYEGEHHALGVILVPDEEDAQAVHLESVPLWRIFWKLARNRGNGGEQRNVPK